MKTDDCELITLVENYEEEVVAFVDSVSIILFTSVTSFLTGVAQRHSHLFVSDRHRMPGILQGQVYTYPARRWKTQRRSYLASLMQVSLIDICIFCLNILLCPDLLKFRVLGSQLFSYSIV